MNVIALDPGVTTGYAQGHIENEVMIVVSGQEKFDHIGLWKLLESIKPDYIIYESFEFRHGIHKRHGAEMYPRELIGIVSLYEQQHPDCISVKQRPMKDGPTTFFNNKRLKELGMYKPAQDHGNDALRHLLYWAKFKGGSQFVKKYRQGVL